MAEQEEKKIEEQNPQPVALENDPKYQALVGDPRFAGLLQSVQAYNSYVENMRIMGTIVAEMKEVPIMESEKPKDINPLEKVEFPPEGGVLTYMGGQEYPYRGFPYFEFVEKIDALKKINTFIVSGVYHALKKRNKIFLFFEFLLLAPIIRNVFWAYIFSYWRIVDRFKLKTERYSKAIRELYRCFSVEGEKESEQIKDLRLMLRDWECMILEFDNAYRFRLQDISEEIDKESLKKNPVHELQRLLDILIERENTVEQKDKWRLFKKFVSYYLRFDRKLLRCVVNIITNLNIEEFKLQVEDKHYCKPRKDYSFGFSLREQKVENK